MLTPELLRELAYDLANGRSVESVSEALMAASGQPKAFAGECGSPNPTRSVDANGDFIPHGPVVFRTTDDGPSYYRDSVNVLCSARVLPKSVRVECGNVEIRPTPTGFSFAS